MEAVFGFGWWEVGIVALGLIILVWFVLVVEKEERKRKWGGD